MISYYGFVKLLQQQQQKTQDVEMTSSSYATRHLKILNLIVTKNTTTVPFKEKTRFFATL